jgi:hypothetical protein
MNMNVENVIPILTKDPNIKNIWTKMILKDFTDEDNWREIKCAQTF